MTPVIAFMLFSANMANAADWLLEKKQPVREVNTMKIHIEVEGKKISATLVDNATSRDFISLLPLTLTLRDYAGTEKISAHFAQSGPCAQEDLPKQIFCRTVGRYWSGAARLHMCGSGWDTTAVSPTWTAGGDATT
jgi:hypothetical protein